VGSLETTNLSAPFVVARAGSALLEAGERVGRYEVEALIGKGGMGEVYRANDRDLARLVAIKVLHGGLASRTALHEAQSMARLSHPHVVTVYDVGLHAERVYVAMEYVDGVNLREWLKREPRPWRRVLAALIAAGEGLAATHRTGLVHRDFKPDNVLIGRDGRVRVGDFGLAFVAAAGAPETLAGTPAYMAPERAADARADQYAFCVTLHEALYGRRPDEEGGRAREASVPAWVRAVVKRGLSADPAQRYPSMDAVVAALSADPARTRRRLAATAGLVALTLGGAHWLAADRPTCNGGSARLVGAWDDAVRERVRARFAALGGAERFERVGARLDAYAGDFSGMFRDSCLATQRREQSEALLDLRVACLDRHAGELRALTGMLAELDAATLPRAIDAVLALEPLDGCADASALTAALPPPADAATRAHVAGLRGRLASIAALEHLGRDVVALPLARAAVDEARTIPYPHIQAEAWRELSQVLFRGGDGVEAIAAAHQARAAAGRAHDDPLLAEIGARLLRDMVDRLTRGRIDPSVPDLIELVQAEVERADQNSRAQHFLAVARARYFYHLGRFDEELAAAQAAARLPGAAEGHEDDPADAEGNALKHLGHYAAAEALLLAALAHMEREYGPDHFQVASALINLASVLRLAGRTQDAAQALERAIAVEERLYGPDYFDLGRARMHLGRVRSDEGRHAEAQELLGWAIASRRRAGPSGRHILSRALVGLGVELGRAGRPGEALALLDEALADGQRDGEPESPELAEMVAARADVLAAAGRHDEACAAWARALGMRERLLGPVHPDLALSLTAAAQCAPEPAPLLERALRIYALTPGRPEDVAATRAGLARARGARP
jgi:serine/threonine-protein kinase